MGGFYGEVGDFVVEDFGVEGGESGFEDFNSFESAFTRVNKLCFFHSFKFFV